MKPRLLSGGVAAALAVAALALRVGLPLVAAGASAPLAGCSVGCGTQPTSAALTRPLLDRLLELGQQFLLANQRPEGNFNYEYDWKKKKLSTDDNQVRQAGALWGLALLYHARREEGLPAEELAAGFIRAVDYFAANSKTGDGRRWVVYPKDSKGSTGTVALCALGLIDFLRADPPLPPARRTELEGQLSGYLAQLQAARRPDGLFMADYAHGDGKPYGGNNPYADGESMLAMIKAAKYLGHEELKAPGLASAQIGFDKHVVAARKKNADSDTTKGFYQWGTMTFFELATSGWPETAVFSERAIEMAIWMIDTHNVLNRGRNTGYAFEGLIHAWKLASLAGDQAHMKQIGRAIDLGLPKLTSWQVGGPNANDCIGSPPADPLAIGGVQNQRSEPGLRIDVAQHQMHAVVLARRYYRTK